MSKYRIVMAVEADSLEQAWERAEEFPREFTPADLERAKEHGITEFKIFSSNSEEVIEWKGLSA